jgi:hypothetical protein
MVFLLVRCGVVDKIISVTALRRSVFESGPKHRTLSRKVLINHLFLNSRISRDTIFINIASFRDKLCVHTVRDIFMVAKHPERVFVGVIEQRISKEVLSMPTEYYRAASRIANGTLASPNVFAGTPTRFLSCYKAGGFCPSENVRSRVVWETEARGPTYGRFVAGLLYQGEVYYMMIDSHTRFMRDYDEFVILDVLRMRNSYVSTPSTHTANFSNGVDDPRFSSNPNGFASPEPTSTNNGFYGGVISQYPSFFDHYNETLNMAQQSRLMCKGRFFEKDNIYHLEPLWALQPGRPVIHHHIGGGFMFGEATILLRVPFDPYLDYTFDGEEILYSLRLYTHGVDSYLPGRTQAFHRYYRVFAHFYNAPKSPYKKIQPITRLRVHYFMQMNVHNPVINTTNATVANSTFNATNVSIAAAQPVPTRPPDRLLVNRTRAHAAGVDVSEDVYGLGSVRTLAKFYEFSRINVSTWEADQKNLCPPIIRFANGLHYKFKI